MQNPNIYSLEALITFTQNVCLIRFVVHVAIFYYIIYLQQQTKQKSLSYWKIIKLFIACMRSCIK